MEFFVKISNDSLRKVEKGFGKSKKIYKKIIIPALNKTCTGARTDAVNEISKQITVPKSKIRRSTKTYFATRIEGESKCECKGYPTPLLWFKARKVNDGVSFQISKKNKKKSILKGAFIADLGNGHMGVFWRAYKDKPGYRPKPTRNKYAFRKYINAGDKYRVPIRERFGPSMPQIMDDKEIMDNVLEKSSKRLEVEIDRQMIRNFKKCFGE